MASTANRLTPIEPLDELSIELKTTQILNNPVAEAPTHYWEAFKRVICCCFSVAQQSHHVNTQPEPLSSKQLVANYGELIAKTAQLLTHVDLDKQSFLSKERSKVLTDTAQFIQNHLAELKKMIQHVRYYNDALQGKGAMIETDDPSEAAVSLFKQEQVDFDVSQVDVIKRNGTIEKFAQQKIINGLQEAPFEVPLTEGQIDEIVTCVKQQIAVLQTAGINAGFIRTIVHQESTRRGAQIIPPPFMSQIFNAEIIQHLQKVKGVDNLTAEDCAALVQCLPGYSDVNELADLAPSDSSLTD